MVARFLASSSRSVPLQNPRARLLSRSGPVLREARFDEARSTRRAAAAVPLRTFARVPVGRIRRSDDRPLPKRFLGVQRHGFLRPLTAGGASRLPPRKGLGKAVRAKPRPDPEASLSSCPMIIGGMQGPIADEVSGWKLVLNDDFRRSFASFRRGVFSAAVLDKWWEKLLKLKWEQPFVGQRILPRKAAWLTDGDCRCVYRYGGTSWPALRMEPWFLDITKEVCDACGIKELPNSCNANLYEGGKQSVGWHSDDESLFDATRRDALIISLSLGATRTFELRPDDDPGSVTSVSLDEGDLLTMEGLVQKHYKHRLVPDARSHGSRINLTWRWVVAHDADCPLHSRVPSTVGTGTTVVGRKRTFDAELEVAPFITDRSEFTVSAGEKERREKRLKRFNDRGQVDGFDAKSTPAAAPTLVGNRPVGSSRSEGIMRDDSSVVQKSRRAEHFGLAGGSQTAAKLERCEHDVPVPPGSSSIEQQMKRTERLAPVVASAGNLARKRTSAAVDECRNNGIERDGPVSFLIAGTSSRGDSVDKMRSRAERFGPSVGMRSEKLQRVVQRSASPPLGARDGSSQSVAARPAGTLATTLPAVAAEETARRQAREQRFANAEQICKRAVATDLQEQQRDLQEIRDRAEQICKTAKVEAQTAKVEVAPAKLLKADSEAAEKQKRQARFAADALQPPAAVSSVASLSSADTSRLSEKEKRALRAQRFK